MKLQKPKGTQDRLGRDIETYSELISLARSTFEGYNFKEIETPLFESYELFSRATGETSDIVTKEMYDFEDKGGRHIALRPEGTASVVRAYIENKLYAPEIQKPVKLWYHGPMFRYERPQAGRLREFHQIGVECLGAKNPAIDVEVMLMAYDFFEFTGLRHLKFHLNTLGDAASRKAYHQALVDYLTPYENELSEDSKRRLLENPLRILDSKEAQDIAILENAPSVQEYLSQESAAYFTAVREMLEALEIDYELDAKLVRGLDYYNDTVFELMTTIDGKELTLCGGGRYDGLVSYFDGPETPGFGFAIGVERLQLLLEQQEVSLSHDAGLQVYMAVLGERASYEASKLLYALRREGIVADRDYLNRKIVAQYKSAESYGAELIITLGDAEMASKIAKVRVVATRKEVEIPLAELYDNFAEIYMEILEENEG
ncbi:MAG: histidine--tRNA ligase [Streptococcaceae bacterium]|jgi:histidyl-tRNA synthetase|nr:histidine--tRNA ligase [Streptococcaceae bacterium]